MTAQEIKTALNEYATEDVQLAKDSGGCFITDTKLGCIDLEYNGRAFSARTNNGGLHKFSYDEADMIVWLANQYVVEA